MQLLTTGGDVRLAKLTTDDGGTADDADRGR
jgi:hypothetical protein